MSSRCKHLLTLQAGVTKLKSNKLLEEVSILAKAKEVDETLTVKMVTQTKEVTTCIAKKVHTRVDIILGDRCWNSNLKACIGNLIEL